MSEAYQRFLESLKIDYGKWLDETGYDLDALRELTAEEQKSIEASLFERGIQNWRDIEALDVIGSDRSVEAIRQGLTNTDLDIQVASARSLRARGLLTNDDIETMLVELLKKCDYHSFLSIRRLIQDYPTAAVRQMLLWNTLYGDPIARRPTADFIYFLYGLSASPAYSDHGTGGFTSKLLWLRKRAFLKLCRAIGEDPSWVLSNSPTPR
jgi:hypothetical protein